MTTRVGLLRGGNGGVLSTLEVAPALAAAAAFKFLTVDTLKFEPSESLLDVMLNLDGDELPVEYGAVRPTTEILSVDADKTRPLTASTTGRFSIGWCRPVAADDLVVVVDRVPDGVVALQGQAHGQVDAGAQHGVVELLVKREKMIG